MTKQCLESVFLGVFFFRSGKGGGFRGGTRSGRDVTYIEACEDVEDMCGMMRGRRSCAERRSICRKHQYQCCKQLPVTFTDGAVM